MFEYFLKEPFNFHIMTHMIVQKILMTTRHKPHVKNQENQENQENRSFICKFYYILLFNITLLILN